MSSNSGNGNTSAFGRGHRTKIPSARMRELLSDADSDSRPPTLTINNLDFESDHSTPPASDPGPDIDASIVVMPPNRSSRRLPTRHRAPALPSFAPDRFMIYNWPTPRPRDFVNISSDLHKWKDNEDKTDWLLMLDDGADDWCGFAGGASLYPDGNAHQALERAIGRTFVNRAKRAHLSGQSWRDFEQVELHVDPRAKAKAAKNPVMQRRLLREVIDNDLRLTIFDELKGRLCQEIWLQDIDDVAMRERSAQVNDSCGSKPDVASVKDQTNPISQKRPEDEHPGLGLAVAGGQAKKNPVPDSVSTKGKDPTT